METLFHIATLGLVVAFFVFIVAASLGVAPFSRSDREDVEKAKEALAGDARLIDVRTPSEFEGDGLPDAMNLPVGELDGRLDELGDADEAIVVYCRSGNRSRQVRRKLRRAGFDRVYDLGGRRTAAEAVDEVAG